jgi:hypothetical protein
LPWGRAALFSCGPEYDDAQRQWQAMRRIAKPRAATDEPDLAAS